VIFNLAGVFHLIYKQVCGVIYIEDVEEVFHCQADAVKHFFAFRAAYGDNHSTSIAAGSGDEGLLQDVLVSPKALAAVDKGFYLGADGHKKYGRRENDAVGVEHFCGDELVIVFDDTASRLVTGVALDAGSDFVICQSEIFGLCAGGFCASQSPAEKQVTVAVKPGTCRDSDYFQSHIGSRVSVFGVKSNRGKIILMSAIDRGESEKDDLFFICFFTVFNGPEVSL
jgi:hypothetical protein